MPITLTPTDDRIIVEPDELRDDITDAGIVVKVAQTIESKRHLGKTGIVVAVGPGKRNSAGRRIPLELNVGDRVVFGEFEHHDRSRLRGRYVFASGKFEHFAELHLGSNHPGTSRFIERERRSEGDGYPTTL